MENDAKLAQWYLESGSDDKWWAVLPFAAGVVVWPLAPIFIPFAIYIFVRGCRKRGKGQRMNEAAGRENFERVRVGRSRFMAHTPLRHERYGQLSQNPPGHEDHYEIPSGGTESAEIYHEDYYEISSGGNASARS